MRAVPPRRRDEPPVGRLRAALDPLRNESDYLHQLDRAAAAVAERRVMRELCRLTPRGDVFERYVFDEEERPGSELLRQALNGRLDVLDDVGVVVCSLPRRSKKILRHDSLLGLVQAARFIGDHNSWSRLSTYFLPFGKLT